MFKWAFIIVLFMGGGLMSLEDKNIKELLCECIEESGGVGAAVAVIDQGKISYFTYGNKADGEPVTLDTVFDIGSITKVFTTFLLKDLEVRGELNLHDLAELPGVRIPEKITLFHLATHSSGLPRLPDNFHPQDMTNPYVDYTLENLVAFLNGYALTREPGAQVEYSNVGTALLGTLLCRKTGKSYEQLVQERLLKPLGMDHSAITLTPEMQRQYATGYHLKKATPHWDIHEPWEGTGALRSTIQDMAKFLAANMGNSPLSGLLQACHQKQLPAGPDINIGLGWFISKEMIIWHNGGTGGFRSYLGFNPHTGQGVVILSNSSEDWPDEFAQCLLDPSYKKTKIDQALANNPEYMQQFVGSYEATLHLPEYGSKQNLEITLYGNLLASALSGGEVGMLYPIEKGVFGIKGFPQGRVRFEFDALGQVAKVTALLEDGTLIWEAVPKNEN